MPGPPGASAGCPARAPGPGPAAIVWSCLSTIVRLVAVTAVLRGGHACRRSGARLHAVQEAAQFANVVAIVERGQGAVTGRPPHRSPLVGRSQQRPPQRLRERADGMVGTDDALDPVAQVGPQIAGQVGDDRSAGGPSFSQNLVGNPAWASRAGRRTMRLKSAPASMVATVH